MMSPEALNAGRVQYVHCLLCEHRCGVDRVAGERGVCKAGPRPRVFRHRVEYGEELELLPCHLFYLSGCDLRCKFCIAEENAFDPSRGTELTPEFFREAVAFGRERGAKTLQWVGGEPTIHLPGLLDVMAEYERSVGQLPPVVWKSDFYSTPEVYTLLDGVASTYVADLKFGNDRCAERIASVPRYMEIVLRNLQLAREQTNLIVRHLLLPGHFDCCFRPIVKLLREQLPGVKFSLRDGYLPKWRAKRDDELSRRIERADSESAFQLATESGLNLID